MPKTNEAAPDFTLPDQDGRATSLADFRGRKVVLYFYPKDDTPGCTQQACDLRDRTSELEEREKFHLPFTLLADEDHSVAEAYGVWKEKSMYGRTYWGNERTTFIIDEQGRIAHVLPKVKPAEHVTDILELI
jgi:peroxiredoxin Q/BCP